MPIFFRCSTSPLPRPVSWRACVQTSWLYLLKTFLIVLCFLLIAVCIVVQAPHAQCQVLRTIYANSYNLHFLMSYSWILRIDHHTLSSSFRCHLYMVSSTVATVYLRFFAFCKCCLINIQILVVLVKGSHVFVAPLKRRSFFQGKVPLFTCKININKQIYIDIYILLILSSFV